ncbi:hypothetical protein, partial [Staphylococcus sp. HMSC056G08]|uniref:hypothetical protein n=1 Tax=Staphylococcus sp. HMSC056G08 TaxID=1739350 RepID=UPI001C40331E
FYFGLYLCPSPSLLLLLYTQDFFNNIRNIKSGHTNKSKDHSIKEKIKQKIISKAIPKKVLYIK